MLFGRLSHNQKLKATPQEADLFHGFESHAKAVFSDATL